MSVKKLLILVVLAAVLGGTALTVVGINLWHRPLGPILGLPNQSTVKAAGSADTPINNTGGISSTESTSASPSLLTNLLGLFDKSSSSSQAQCGGPSVMTILLIGSDERADDYLYGLSDSIRLVRVDFTNAKVMMIDIPRDLWVEIPGISDHYGITHGKLNQAYFFGNPGMGYYDGTGEGPGLLARTLELNFGVQVDHYLAVDRSTFVSAIDALGGIDVQLDSSIDLNLAGEGDNPDQTLNAGTHHLDGAQALQLASSRNPTIFQRARFQTLVLHALQAKLLDPSTYPQIPGLISQFSRSVQTDLSPSEINQLVCIGQKVTPDNTTTVAFPDDMFTGQSTYDPYRQVHTYTLAADFSQIRADLADFMNGIWP